MLRPLSMDTTRAATRANSQLLTPINPFNQIHNSETMGISTTEIFRKNIQVIKVLMIRKKEEQGVIHLIISQFSMMIIIKVKV